MSAFPPTAVKERTSLDFRKEPIAQHATWCMTLSKLTKDLARSISTAVYRRREKPSLVRGACRALEGLQGDILEMAQPGYIYVLVTAYTHKDGLPIVKIGSTTRTPEQRAQELSRGGPAGMKLFGAVTTRDAVALERRVHQAFSGARFIGGGGTEYFTVNPDDVLSWLRAEAPRFEIDTARNDAWREYVESRPWKAKSRVEMFGFSGFIVSWCLGSFWAIGQHNWPMVIAMPFITGGIFAFAAYMLKEAFLPDNIKALETVRTALEEKYHLPPGSLINGPTVGYKHRSQ
jgi:hypothetical protein